MHIAWTKNLRGDSKAKRQKEVLSYANAFDDLKEVLTKHFKKKAAVRDYDVPNWDVRQVGVNEYNQAIDDLISLITLDKE